ncbi:hypothetical protein RRG08_019869 [Elysia crispata]|uniref:Uncharacterized protein n=1 Tax=Elysia crispata TaxID=231223 RepID=A0AAE1AE56_9GAST|nr:hypothetical protein RRG08_019869 [Elysia crispata]
MQVGGRNSDGTLKGGECDSIIGLISVLGSTRMDALLQNSLYPGREGARVYVWRREIQHPSDSVPTLR